MAKVKRKPVTKAPDIIGDEDTVPIAPDRSGWTPHASERRDFLNRIRAFPPSVSTWRRQVLDRIRTGKPPLPLTGNVNTEQLSDRLDDGISYLREIARILAVLYSTPDLGNKADPTDELVYILLARHTREGAYQQAFEALKRRFSTWDELLDGPRNEVERLVYSGGLSGKKTIALYTAL